ncbi:unnamed protein product [Acanthoscelides obtectus]|uniref:Gamma-interferon-inducible lysosomal thiol reductase n=1 Tax=Acanthoscelides obtectus TaxID=200917 RepID=A0A9P0PHE1_ACAOB|nr:unnamed protein product [Acanthoscelides obtectus]CAK1635874.1 GILT-like protein 1 [Acanthoscelides obtectus]
MILSACYRAAGIIRVRVSLCSSSVHVKSALKMSYTLGFIFSGSIVLVLFRFSHVECVSKLKVSLYYGSYDPMSKKFIKEQLYPTYEKLQDYLDIEIIPFGNARMSKEDGKYDFGCRFGPKECSTNEVHSCVVDMHPGIKALQFLRCSAMEHDPYIVIQKCAENATIPYQEIKQCYDTRGSQLLVANGVKSLEVGYTFIPAIVFNDKYDPKESILGQTNMFVYVCTLFETPPEICASKLYRR